MEFVGGRHQNYFLFVVVAAVEIFAEFDRQNCFLSVAVAKEGKKYNGLRELEVVKIDEKRDSLNIIFNSKRCKINTYLKWHILE